MCGCVWWWELLCRRGDNCAPFAVMSGCLPHSCAHAWGLRGPVTHPVHLAHIQVWWSTWCHRGQTELISCHCLWTSPLFSFPSFCWEYNNTILQCLQRGGVLLNVFLLKGSFLGCEEGGAGGGAATALSSRLQRRCRVYWNPLKVLIGCISRRGMLWNVNEEESGFMECTVRLHKADRLSWSWCCCGVETIVL